MMTNGQELKDYNETGLEGIKTNRHKGLKDRREQDYTCLSS